jgi:hypothetical protein
MNGSAMAACALVACETEFFVRRVGHAFESRQINRALQWLGIWIVPPTPAPARVKSQGLAQQWHVLLSIAVIAGTFFFEPAAASAQCCGMGSPSCGSCGSCGGAPSFCGSPCGGAPCCGSPCGGAPCCGSPCGGPPCCGSPCGGPMPFFGRPGCGCQPSCCRPMGCCGGGCGGGCPTGCGYPRLAFGFFPGGNCCPNYAPRCGSPCGCSCGPSCGLACGPSCGCGSPACGSPGCGSCGSACGCAGVPAVVGNVSGSPMPTYDIPSGAQPSSSNKTGPPPSIDPNDAPPTGPPAPIKQRSATPPADGSSKFQRDPQSSLDSSGSLDPSQTSADPVGVVEKRFFRQTVSAGFHTRVAIAAPIRLVSQTETLRPPAARDFEAPLVLAQTD